MPRSPAASALPARWATCRVVARSSPRRRRRGDECRIRRLPAQAAASLRRMGVVYIAEHRRLRRTAAPQNDPRATFAADADVARFTVEAEAAAALDHPNIVADLRG
ncbi:MAG: hypothetical protein R3F11_20240 [Verrucomicrobiales bacterium]